MVFTEEEYQRAIDAMPEEFTSHDFIRALSWMYQRLYIEFLYDYKDTDTPFQIVHGQLAQRLHEWDTLESLGQVESVDIFGNRNGCVKWKKRS